MEAPLSRRDRLMEQIGGEQNLPPKLPPPKTDETSKQTSSTEDPFNKLPSVEDVLQEEQSENWWDATPRIAQLTQPIKQPVKNSTVIPQISHRGAMSFDFDPRKGETAPLGLNFSPFLAVTKFPYKFVKKELLQPLASAFFDEGKIWNREWDIYFIWSDYYQTGRPVTFIPEYQLLALVDEINEYSPDAKIKITDELREEGLVINFDGFPQHLRPSYLGKSTSRPQYNSWTDNLPLPMTVQGNVSSGDRSLEEFRAKMELATEIAKNKTKARKEKRQVEHVVKRQDMVRSLLRAQRYLGLLAEAGDSPLPDISNLSLSAIDYNVPAPHACDQDVIFIAVDVEAYERPPRPVTEIGVATLDTRDLLGQPPGNVGENWQQFIRARHFRIVEYKNLINTEFLAGAPDKFEFGKTEFIGKDSIGKSLAACFKQPFSGSGTTNAQEKRNIVLLGHDIMQDINYLQQVGFSVFNSGSVMETVDTADMFRSYTKDPNARSLGSILYEFDLMGWHLHNAGNDALYTIWAMIAICVKAASERGSAEAERKHAENLEKRVEEAVERAEERINDEFEGWESTGDDGGVSVPPTEARRGSLGKENGEGNRRLYTIGGAILDV